MNPIQPALDALCADVAGLTVGFGRRVDASSLGILDRQGHLALNAPGLVSPNGACRLVRAADGWIAVNLARAEDLDLVPAWLACELGEDPWALIDAHAGEHTQVALIDGAALLGLPVAAVGEVIADHPQAPLIRMAAGVARRDALRVVDLSALWAGPLCGAILAAMGAAVTKVESIRRPDPTRTSAPEFFHSLNGAKGHLALDLLTPDGQARLREQIAVADVLITGARPRAFASLGLDPTETFATNPGLVWVAVTAYGWTGEAARRVGFGDDTAAAGGLVRWTPDGPHFLGDALADPLTGLAAAAGALQGLQQGGGLLVDVALARSAAGAAALCRLPRAA